MVFIPFFVFQCLVHFLLNPQKQGISEVCFCSLFCRLIPLAAWRKKKERKKTKESDSAWIEIRVKKERIRTPSFGCKPIGKEGFVHHHHGWLFSHCRAVLAFPFSDFSGWIINTGHLQF
jgi:hypothetical protein